MARLEKQTELLLGQAATQEAGTEDNIAAVLRAGNVNGAVPFAMLARHGFIAVTFLKSLVRRGVLAQSEVDAFIGSIRTVAAELVSDLYEVHCRHLPREKFLEKYGHLRPGTYDISSPRYDSQPDFFLSGQRSEPTAHERFHLSEGQRTRTAGLLAETSIAMDAGTFLTYVAEAIGSGSLQSSVTHSPSASCWN